MREDLMRELRRVTEEEEQLLAGGQVDKSLYTSGGGFLIDSDKLLAKGKLITVRPHTRFAAFPMHTHNYVEIMYMCSGQTIHQIEGRPPLTLRTGELLFLNQHASHAVERAGEEDVGVNFIVLPQFFDVALNLIGTDNVLGKFLLSGLRQSGGEMSCLHFRVAEAPTVQNLVENLVWSLVHPQPNARRINQATMGLLLLQLLNYTEDLEEASGNGAVLAALREIEENYRTADLTRLAAELHVSLPYLSAAVHRATGRTFKELLLEKRLSKAAQLLRETRLTTQDIILAVGYENTSYFYRVFRARFGVTPQGLPQEARRGFPSPGHLKLGINQKVRTYFPKSTSFFFCPFGGMLKQTKGGNTMETYLAVDIGASSGRHILGWVEEGRLCLEEIYRFENTLVRKNGRLCWDMERLAGEVLRGLERCRELGKIPSTMGIDTWAVDYVLLDERGQPLGDTVA